MLWEEVQKIADAHTRQRVISGAVERLAEKYELETTGNTVEERMQSVVKLFADRQIPISLEKQRFAGDQGRRLSLSNAGRGKPRHL